MGRRLLARQRPIADVVVGGPVFVLGAPQSGATALAWALGQHPALQVLHGAGWMTRLCVSLAVVEAEGRRVDRTRSTITGIGQLAQGGVRSNRFWRSFGAGIHALTTPVDPGPEARHRNGSGHRNGSTRSGGAPRRWVSAEPDLDRVVHALDLLFPDARFVHVVRSAEAAISAMSTKSRGNPKPVPAGVAAARWLEAVGNGLDAEAALGDAIIRLEHETMATDAPAALERCFGHLGLDWDDACLRPLRGALRPDALPAGSIVPELHRNGEIAAMLGRLLLPRAGATGPDAARARERLEATLARHADLVDPGSAVPDEVRRCRELVERCVPSGSTVAVISKGDDALLDLQGLAGLHLPQTEDGTYAGHHPGSSEDAITAVKALQGRGASHLVVPASSSWWLEHYTGLREHLLAHGEVVGYEADVGVVFGLGAAVQGSAVLRAALPGRPAAQHHSSTPASPPRHVDEDAAALGRLFADATDHFVIWGEGAGVTTPEGWPVRSLGRWRAASHPALPARELVDRTGERLGWVLGVAIAPDLDAGFGPIRLDVDGAAGPGPFEEALYQLAGRWACIVDAPWGSRVHLDAGGTLAAVHATDREAVASTTSLLQAVLEGPGFERPPVDVFPADRQNQFFPGGLTHLPWAQRLLPNHHLDLGDWSARRHWPCGDIPSVDELGLVTELQRIAGGIGTVMRGLAGSFDLHLGLTAGRDSRVLLACGRHVRDSISTFTFDYGADVPGSTVDVTVARELARRAGVPHVVIPVDEPSAGDRADYLFAIGHAGHWGKCRDFGAIGRHRKPSGALVPGFLGGLGRGHYWSGMPKQREALTPEVLLRRLRLPDEDRFLRAMGTWVGGLPELAPRLLLDLLYLEHRGGSWASAHLYGASRFAAVVVPFASRQVLDAMFRLPASYRVKKRLYDDLVRLGWPELLDLPFQTLPDGTS
jgi:hypothetical protein